MNAQLEKVFRILRRRQNDQGEFGYWAPETDEKISFNSVYVMDFLSTAKTAGFAPPADMFASGLRYLQKMVAREPTTLPEARSVAYAIYILTREGVVTTNYILNLRDYLEQHQTDLWKNDITGVYLAGALKLLHKDKDADDLIAAYKIDKGSTRDYDDFCQPLGSNAQYIALLAHAFPERLKKISGQEFEQILQPIGRGEFNTLSAAYAVSALKSYSHMIAQKLPQLSIAEIHRDKREVGLTSGAKLLQRTAFSKEAIAIRFKSAGTLSGLGAFFQVVEAGYDRHASAQPVTAGFMSGCMRALCATNRSPMLPLSIFFRADSKSWGHPCNRVFQRFPASITSMFAKIALSSTERCPAARSRSIIRSNLLIAASSPCRPFSPRQCTTETSKAAALEGRSA